MRGKGIKQFCNYFWELWWWDERHSLLFRSQLKEPHDTLQDGENGFLAENRIGPWAVLEWNLMFLVSNDPKRAFPYNSSPSGKPNSLLGGAMSTITYDTHFCRLDFLPNSGLKLPICI